MPKPQMRGKDRTKKSVTKNMFKFKKKTFRCFKIPEFIEDSKFAEVNFNKYIVVVNATLINDIAIEISSADKATSVVNDAKSCNIIPGMDSYITSQILFFVRSVSYFLMLLPVWSSSHHFVVNHN